MAIAVNTQGAASLDWRMGYPQVAAEPRSTVSIESTTALPPWWDVVRARLFELLELPVGWDGHHARRVSDIDLADALRFLARIMNEDTKPPWIGPLVTGGLELAWREGDLDVEAIFDHARGERELLVSVGESEWEAPIDQADGLFSTVVARLGGLAVAT